MQESLTEVQRRWAARRLSTSPPGLDESGRNQMLAVAIAARDSIGAVQLNGLLPQCL
jgi:hypothetical protein